MLHRAIVILSLVALLAPAVRPAAARERTLSSGSANLRSFAIQEEEAAPATCKPGKCDDGDIGGVATNAETGERVYTSPIFDYSVTWNQPWDLTEKTSGGGYDSLHLVSGDSDLYSDAYVAYGGDSDACIDDGLSSLQSDPSVTNLAVVGRTSNVTATPAPSSAVAISRVTYSWMDADGSVTEYTQSILCQTLRPGAAVLVVTFSAPTSTYDALTSAADELLSKVVLPAPPPPIDVSATLSNVEADLNAYWQTVFEAAGLTYTVPIYVNFDGPVQTACVDTAPFAIGPFYCPLDTTVYFDMPVMNQEVTPFGSFVIAFVTAHEVGHHVEELLDIKKCLDAACANGIPSFFYELLADCFAGSWAADATNRGLIAPGEVESTIVALASFFGDKGAAVASIGDPQSAHGPGSQRT